MVLADDARYLVQVQRFECLASLVQLSDKVFLFLPQRRLSGVLLWLEVIGVQFVVGLDVVADAAGYQVNKLVQPDGVAGAQALLAAVGVQLAAQVALLAVGTLAHGGPAIGALDQPGQQVGFAGAVGFGAQFEGTLDGVEGGPVDDGLMGAFHPVPLAFRGVDDDFRFVADLFPAALDHHPSIHLVGEDAAHRHLVPQAEIVLHRVVAGPAPFGFVTGGVGHALLVEQISNVLPPVTLHRPLENLANHLGGLGIRNDMVFVCRVLLVAIDGKSADILALPPLQVEHHADVLGQIL